MSGFPRFVILVILLCAVMSCREKLPEDFDYGHVSEGVYYNEFFDFSMEIPEGYYVYSQEEIARFLQVGKQFVEQRSGTPVKAKDISMGYLLVISQPSHRDGEAEYMMNVVADNLSDMPSITTPRKYIDMAVNNMKRLNMYEDLDTPVDEVLLGGKRFYSKARATNVSGSWRHSTMYVTIENNFALMITVTYSDPMDEADLKEVLGTIKFGGVK